MAKDTITVHGEERVVREDTAKAYRAINWTWISIGAFILIVVVLAGMFFFRASTDGSIESPGTIQQQPR